MIIRKGGWWAIALALGACQATPPDLPRHVLHVEAAPAPGAQPTPPEGLGKRWTPLKALSASSVSDHGAAVAIDGNPNTYWDSGTPAEEARLTLSFDQTRHFLWLRVKTGPMAEGVTMKAFTSDDGTTWTPASGRFVNSTSEMQLHEVQGDGKFLQIRFFSRMEGPKERFKLYEVEAYSGS